MLDSPHDRHDAVQMGIEIGLPEVVCKPLVMFMLPFSAFRNRIQTLQFAKETWRDAFVNDVVGVLRHGLWAVHLH